MSTAPCAWPGGRALRNGVTRDVIKEILLHAAVECGAPVALDGFRIAKKALAEAQ